MMSRLQSRAARRPTALFAPILRNTAYLTIALLPLLGCGQEPPRATVEGTLRADGKPLDGPVQRLTLKVDPGTYKNGAAVTVPS